MAVLWFFVGGLAEWVNMLIRRWTVWQAPKLEPGWAVFLILSGFVVRLAWMVLILGLALAQDPAFGIAAFAGYWVSRWVSIGRIMRKTM
ncbi:MAG: hypothetical protein JW934_13370 [Anaerolineae bacterium]|nr:hypothetical protein [Anaerolineae bacterium]